MTALLRNQRLYFWAACGDPLPAHAQVQEPMARALPFSTTSIRRHCLMLVGLSTFLVSGCSHQDGNDLLTQLREGKPQNFCKPVSTAWPP
jgi:hypothetical protein